MQEKLNALANKIIKMEKEIMAKEQEIIELKRVNYSLMVEVGSLKGQIMEIIRNT